MKRVFVGASESSVFQTFDLRYHDELGLDAITLLTFRGVGRDEAFRAAEYRRRGKRVHGHPTLYCKQGFDWGIGREAALARLGGYGDVLGAYLASADVVNEPLHEPCEHSAELYRKAKTELVGVDRCANEYDLHWPSSPKLIELCSWVPRMGANRIGIQLHAMVGPKAMPTVDTVTRALDRLAAVGVPLWFSEVSIPSDRLGWTEKLQSAWLERLFLLARSHPAVDGFSYWDLLDRGAWNPTSGLVREDGSLKPAYWKFRDLVRGQKPWWQRLWR
jgi:GH35 family endo-1,4-beta-xylanase